MKKLLFAICFITIATNISNADAAVTEFASETDARSRMPINTTPIDDNVPTDQEGFRKFIGERVRTVQSLPMDFVEKSGTMNTQRSSEYISAQTESEKSTFQKIYEDAIERFDIQENVPTQDFVVYSLPERPSEQKQEWEQGNLDVVSVTLPDGQSVLVPAKEHIPYLASRIEIMPNGLVRIVETVNVVANGEKLKYGLSKALPKYSVSRNGVRNRIIPYLNGVKINGREIGYELIDSFDRYTISPKGRLPLRPGIYTYEFDYILDRKLWYYGDFNEFYWDVTGSYWNLVVARGVATLRTPINVNPLGQTMFIGYAPNNLTGNGTAITKDAATNVLGFVSTVPLFAGEGMHIIVSLPKSGFIDPDFNKKFEWFVNDFGDIIFTLLGLLAILVAYGISWRDISKGVDSAKTSFAKTPATLRMLTKGRFDKVSFVSYLLDLYRKNLLDIDEKDGNVILVKKSDNIAKKLNNAEKNAFGQIFTRRDTTLIVSKTNILKLKRAAKYVEKDTEKRIKILSLKLSFGYILLSLAMLLLSVMAVSYISVSPWQTFALVTSSAIIMTFYVWLSMLKIKTNWLNWLTKIISVVFIVAAGIFLSTKIHAVSTLFIVAMLYAVFVYTKLFAQRNGLIKNSIAEAQSYAKYLKDNTEKIILGHEFRKEQAYIYALGEQAGYKDVPESKLGLADKIHDMI